MTPRTASLFALGVAAGLAPGPRRAAAQAVPHGDTGQVARAAASITAEDVRADLGIIADDSMPGRATPGPQLEATAAWIAERFRQFGLEPGGDSGSFIQRHPIRRLRVDSTSFVMAMGRGAHGHWRLGREAAAILGRPPAEPLTAPVVLVVGLPGDTARPFGDVPMHGTIVMQVLDTSAEDGNVIPLIARGAAAGVKAWIFVTNRRRSEFARVAAAALRPRSDVPGPADADPLPIPLYEVRDSSAVEVLRAAGEDLAADLAPAAAPGVRALRGFTATVDVHVTAEREVSALNTIGLLRGSDSALVGEVLAFSARMDHIGTTGGDAGCRLAGADTICNGADTDASGAIAVAELAQAFARLDPHPRRSILFMAVSGEERGLWGSGWYADHPAFPLAATVAVLNLDMAGRGPADAVRAVGGELSSLGPLADSAAAAHPELRLRVVRDSASGERRSVSSGQSSFARQGVPVLCLTIGLHADDHRATDSVDQIDAELEARIVRLAFYLGLAVADAPGRPAWEPGGAQPVAGSGP